MPANGTIFCSNYRWEVKLINHLQSCNDISERIDCTALTSLKCSYIWIGLFPSFFISLTFWGLSSLSFTYAKGYAALLVLRSGIYPLSVFLRLTIKVAYLWGLAKLVIMLEWYTTCHFGIPGAPKSTSSLKQLPKVLAGARWLCESR